MSSLTLLVQQKVPGFAVRTGSRKQLFSARGAMPSASGTLAAAVLCRSLVTTKSEMTSSSVAKNASRPVQASKPSNAGELKQAAKPRRLATSARVWPDGFVKPALYDEHTPIPRCEAYPTSYHMGLFPWLLSAERQRIPMSDLEASKSSGSSSLMSHDRQTFSVKGSEFMSAAAQWLPLSARRHLAHKLNMHMARRVLGDQAIVSVCDGAAMVLPNVARLLSAISDGSAAQAAVSASLSGIFSPLLLARFTSDLERLRRDNVQLALEVRRINSSRIHQIRTQAGPAEAFAALADLQAPRAASASGPTG
ncbi:hypothetical protein FB645_004903, partial [Coemansia sp. IMI 203386]